MRWSALVAAALFVSACSKATEVVLRISVIGALPASIDARLRRSTPFADDPMKLPAFVKSALDGPGLVLMIEPQGSETVISLLPAKNAPTDLTVTVSAGGYTVMPVAPQTTAFADGVSKDLSFTLTAPAPDGGAPSDAARDGGGKSGDMARPLDGAATGG